MFKIFDTLELAKKRFDELYKEHECEVDKKCSSYPLLYSFMVKIVIEPDREILDDILTLHYSIQDTLYNEVKIDVVCYNSFIQSPKTLDKIRELFDEVAK